MVIHEQGQVPFPYNEGHSVLPSRSTSFGIRRVGHAMITTIIGRLSTVPYFFVRSSRYSARLAVNSGHLDF